ncbi:MAG TPA: hypothetical protein VHJ76_05320 [Actinomycetota bacterium]|nr:hypothetical protein [Actinomycetota bacterium]
MDDRERADNGNLSRRRFLRHAAAAAWASPLIVTMMSRSAAAGPANCGKKIGGPGTTACHVTTPCGGASVVGCKASPAAPAGSPCYCI